MQLKHPLLLALALVSLIGTPSKGAEPTVPKRVLLEEFESLRARPGHVVLDVRTPEEFKAGHVGGATNLNVNDPEFAKRLATLDKSKTYLVHCARGHRSAAATDKLVQAGFTNVVDFSPGFEAWKKAGKPISKD